MYSLINKIPDRGKYRIPKRWFYTKKSDSIKARLVTKCFTHPGTESTRIGFLKPGFFV